MHSLHPDKGYRKGDLWLPKKYLKNQAGVRATLTFLQNGATTPLHAWGDSPDHLIVPREYIQYADYKDLPYEVIDQSPVTFPLVQVRRRTDPRGPVQRIASDHLLQKGNGVLCLACGLGKTVISLHAWTATQIPALVVVHTKDLLYQWMDRIEEHTTIPREDIGLIQGKSDDWEKPITVAMIHTLAERVRTNTYPVEATRHFGVAIYDECHHVSAPYFNIAARVGQGLRWGLSATPDREDGLDDIYKYHLGEILYTNLEQDTIPEVFFVRTGVSYSDQQMEDIKVAGEVNTAKMNNLLAECPKRNKILVDLIHEAKDEGRKIIVLSHTVEHVEWLSRQFPGSGLIHGGIKGNTRQQILKGSSIVFATTALAKEGLDRKDLDTVVIAMPFKKKGQLQQILGRIQRKHEGKKTPMGIILEDNNLYTARRMCGSLKSHLRQMDYPFRTT